MSTTSLERQSLEAHVDLCAERYERLQEDLGKMSDRLDHVEKLVKSIFDKLNEKENSAMRAMIRVGFSLIVTLLGTVGGLVWYIITNGAG